MSNRQWSGARWWKFDLHTHTPASNDYGKGPEYERLKQLTPRDWLLDYMQAEIDCVAITDHNTGAWIDQVKDELHLMENNHPQGFRPLYLFPGVEISVNGGIHLLAIFDRDKTKSDIDSLLGSVGYKSEKGTSDSDTNRSLTDVIREIVSAGGIPIPAHVDNQKGLFKLSGNSLTQALNNKSIFAVELTDPNYVKPQGYTDQKISWTEVLGSDSHHPSDVSDTKYPGSHFTWIKMGTPSIEGLRLALLDDSFSVIRSDSQTENPNVFAEMTLESMEVSQARYLGRSETFNVRFNPWLNSIIGGRGTGKSTLVEFLRTAMRREDELPNDFRKELVKYREVYKNREDGGLLTEETTIRVYYRKDNTLFRIQWSPNGNLTPIEQQTSEEKWHPSEGDIPHRFPVRIYSQKQIFDLAKKPLALLRVIDEAPQVNHRNWMEQWNQEENKFFSLCSEVRELESHLSQESRLRGELEDIKRKLSVFDSAGYSKILKNFQKLTRQKRSIRDWELTWENVPEKLRKLADQMVPDFLQNETFLISSESDSELQGYANMVCMSFENFSNELKSMATKADQILSQWHQDISSSSWKNTARLAEKNYHELNDYLAKKEQNNPLIYGQLLQDRQLKEDQLEDVLVFKERIKELSIQIQDQLDRMVTLRRTLTQNRTQFLSEVLNGNPYVRIKVVPYGARNAAEIEFRKLLQREGAGFERDIGSPDGEGLLGKIFRDKEASTRTIERNLMDVKKDIRNIAFKKDDVSVKDQRFSNHLSKLPPELIDRIDTWFPEDSLDVQYCATGRKERFLSIKEGSPGQKTAALLAFLLSYGDEPLILDQPEDDLDNLLIYDLIVMQLRSQKRQRQLIIVTHNANIVVNGDSELVLSLTPIHGESKIGSIGCLQEKNVRENICTIMEGGRKAFENRFRRIATGKIDGE